MFENQLMLVLGAIMALLSAGVVAAISFVAVRKVRAFKAARQLKDLKVLIRDMEGGDYYNLDVSRKIAVEMQGFDIKSVIVGEKSYKSLDEALIYEPIGKFHRNQLLKIKSKLDKAYQLSNSQKSQVNEAKQQEAVTKQQTRRDDLVTIIDTGEDMDGKVYIYKPTEFVLGDHLKAEIVQDKETGFMEVAMVWYAPEGNVKSPKALVPFDVRTAKGNKAYKHYIESNSKFYDETEKMNKLFKRLDHYNEILEEGRIHQDKDGLYFIEAPEPKEEKQDNSKETHKDQINNEFDKEEKKEPVAVDDLI